MITVQTFYKTRESQNVGDEFITVSLEKETHGFHVCVVRGLWNAGSPTTGTALWLAKIEDAEREFEKQCDTAREQQFRPAL